MTRRLRRLWSACAYTLAVLFGLRIADSDLATLRALQCGREWIWIAGNHDPDPAEGIGGSFAETLACDASNVTGLVDRLESRGLVRRRPSAADRRVKVLDLTPTGSRLRAVLLDRMTAPPATLGRLSVHEQRALVRILTRLLE